MNKIKNFIFLIVLLCVKSTFSQTLRDSVYVKNQVFEVVYSEVLEQPKWLIYRSTNRSTNVNRGSMDFHTESKIKTSDGADYVKNIYDKGHLAPAASFSDNMENLKQTFSYLNSALQNQYLNRGEWRFLEEQERKWDDIESLTIKVILEFNNSFVLLTGAAIPTAFHKHITWEKSKKQECYYFPNEKPIKNWKEYLNINCKLK